MHEDPRGGLDDWLDDDNEVLCSRCSRVTAGERCGGCGAPICPQCFSSGGGFCGSKCPTIDDGDSKKEITYEINGTIESAIVNMKPGETIQPGDVLVAKLEDDGSVSLWKKK